MCTGSLAAAAISSSSSLSELLPIAVQTVLIAFRLGLCALDMRDRLETSAEDRSQPWSVVVADIDTQTAVATIKEFCDANVRSPSEYLASFADHRVAGSFQNEAALAHRNFGEEAHHQRRPAYSDEIVRDASAGQADQEGHAHLCACPQPSAIYI